MAPDDPLSVTRRAPSGQRPPVINRARTQHTLAPRSGRIDRRVRKVASRLDVISSFVVIDSLTITSRGVSLDLITSWADILSLARLTPLFAGEQNELTPFFWMAGNYLKYSAEESSFGRKTADDLPVDSHMTLALAPRA